MKFVVKEEPVATADSASDAILAVWSSVSHRWGSWSPCNLLSIMFWVSSGFETARLDAIVVVESMVVEGMVPGLSGPTLGLSYHAPLFCGNCKRAYPGLLWRVPTGSQH
jgi:hypothetical protein